jgi:hypothetical protein
MPLESPCIAVTQRNKHLSSGCHAVPRGIRDLQTADLLHSIETKLLLENKFPGASRNPLEDNILVIQR